MFNETQQNHKVSQEWEVYSVDEQEAHEKWFHLPGMTWGCKPEESDFPDWIKFKKETEELTKSNPDMDPDEFHEKIYLPYMISNKFIPDGYEKLAKEISEKAMEDFMAKHGFTKELDEHGNKKPLIIKDKDVAIDMQRSMNAMHAQVDALYDKMFKEQGCVEKPKDPNIIGKQLWFKVVVCEDDLTFRQCLNFTKASTSAPSYKLNIGGGLGLFLGWIQEGETEIQWFEAYPIWNGNKKFHMNKVLEEIDKVCYDTFPKSMEPLFKTLLKKAGFLVDV